MTRRLDRYARVLPILALAAGSALLSAQTLPPAKPAPVAPNAGGTPAPSPAVGATPAAAVEAAPSPATGAAPSPANAVAPVTAPANAVAPVAAPANGAEAAPAPVNAVPIAPPVIAAPDAGNGAAPAAAGTGAPAVGAPTGGVAAGSTTAPTTAPAASDGGAATRPASVSGNQRTDIHLPDATSRPAQLIKLEFKDASLNTVVDYLSEALGFIVKKSGPIEGRISLVSRSPVTPEIALTLLDEALADSGMTAVQQGRILKIVSTGSVKKLTPVRVGNNPEEIADTAEWITQVIPVKNIDAVKLRQDIQPMVSGDADFAANQGSNALIVTDTSANIRRLVTIIAKLDESTGKASEVKIYHLQFSNATSTAKLITTIFSPEGAQGGQAGGPGGAGGGGPGRMFRAMMMGGGGPGGAGGAGGADSGRTTGKVTATADDRTSNIVVVAPGETIKLIDTIVKELDSDPTAQSTIKTFQLKFADAPSAAKLITSVFGQDQQTQGNRGGGGFPFGGGFNRVQNVPEAEANGKVSAAAADKSNTLVVTAPPGVMKVISEILNTLDEDPAARSQVVVFQLKFADSDSAAKLVNSIFQSDSTTGSTGGGQQSQNRGGGGGFGRGGFGGGGGGGPEINGVNAGAARGYVNAVSDPRTNTIVVTAPSDSMRIISGILEKLDSNPSAESALFIYHLRNGVAADIQQTMSNLFSTGTTGTSSNNNTNRTSGQSLVSSGLGSNSGFGSGGGRSSGGLGGSGGGLGGSSSSFGQPLSSVGSSRATGASGNTSQAGASVRATSELVGQVIVVADNDTNSLIVSTASKYREQVTKIIQELDRPVPQVLIKVLVAEVTHDRTNDFGPDFSILNTRANGKGLSLSQALGNVPAFTSSGGLVVSLAEDNLNAALHALSTEGKLDVLSRPYILASDNQAASITIGQEVPFITATQITDTGQQINTITYQAVGIILNVTPHINPDGAVTLDVAPEISAISATTVPIGNGINAPVIDNRSAQSRVTVRNGNTIVIGGMMQDQKTSTVNKIPLLGDIPYLGAIFSRTQTDVSKTELLIFLTPHVAAQPDSLKPMSDEELKGTKLVPGAVSPGTFDEHRAGLERGATTTQSTTQPSTVEIKATPSTQPFSGINISSPPTTAP